MTRRQAFKVFKLVSREQRIGRHKGDTIKEAGRIWHLYFIRSDIDWFRWLHGKIGTLGMAELQFEARLSLIAKGYKP
jgi:hypothetical protein